MSNLCLAGGASIGVLSSIQCSHACQCGCTELALYSPNSLYTTHRCRPYLHQNTRFILDFSPSICPGSKPIHRFQQSSRLEHSDRDRMQGELKRVTEATNSNSSGQQNLADSRIMRTCESYLHSICSLDHRFPLVLFGLHLKAVLRFPSSSHLKGCSHQLS